MNYSKTNFDHFTEISKLFGIFSCWFLNLRKISTDACYRKTAPCIHILTSFVGFIILHYPLLKIFWPTSYHLSQETIYWKILIKLSSSYCNLYSILRRSSRKGNKPKKTVYRSLFIVTMQSSVLMQIINLLSLFIN